MQFLFAKVLFQRNPKAALISIDSNISESTTYVSSCREVELVLICIQV